MIWIWYGAMGVGYAPLGDHDVEVLWHSLSWPGKPSTATLLTVCRLTGFNWGIFWLQVSHCHARKTDVTSLEKTGTAADTCPCRKHSKLPAREEAIARRI